MSGPGSRTVLAALLAALCLALPGSAPAQEDADEPPRWAYRMPHDLMSPFCPGRTLAECTSPQADQLRLWILVQASAGAPREEVEAALLERFGDKILSAPRAEGWGITAYALPIGGFVLGGIVVAVVLRRMARPGGAGQEAAPRPGGAGQEAAPRPGGAGQEAAPPPAASRRPAPVAASDAELERWVDEELRA